MKKIGILLSIVLLVTLAAAVPAVYSKVHVYGDETEMAAVCGKDGCIYRTCRICGKIEYLKTLPALPHDFGETVRSIRYETAQAVCALCGKIEDRAYIPPENIPRLYVEGKPGGTVIPVSFRYVDAENEQYGYALISVNGSIDRVDEKPDYNVSLYSDDTFSEPVSYDFGEKIGETAEVTLHADYNDASGGSLNLAASVLWEQTVESRSEPNRQIEMLPHKGADVGKPILLYTNGNFKGIYTLCMPDNGAAFGLNGNGALLYTYTLFGQAPYSVVADGITVPVTAKYASGDDMTAYVESFQNMLAFAETASDTRFAERIEQYLDVDAAIDYMIFLYALNERGHEILKCNFVTYDGKRWIPSLYAAEISFDSESAAPCAPYVSNGETMSDLSYTLYDRILRQYSEKAAARYRELRSTVLSAENIKNVFEACNESLTEEILNAEREEYPNRKRIETADSIVGHILSFRPAADDFFAFEPKKDESPSE